MKRLTVAVLALCLGLAAAGVAIGATSLKIAASPSALKYSTSKLSAAAGSVTITMSNPSPLRHNVAIKGNGVNVKGKTVGKGGVSKVTVTLKKGTYEFYCTLLGHEAAGMKGTLVVH